MSGDALILPDDVTTQGIPLSRYRQRLADELGFWLRTQVSSIAHTGRVVVADEVRDDELGYEFLGAPWVYVRDGAQAGTQRRMLSQPGIGYIGPRSVLVLSRPFAAPLLTGVTIDITSPLPVKRHLTIKGLDDCVNEALERIWVEIRYPITGNGTRSYTLPLWLNRADIQFRGLYTTPWTSSAEPNELSPRRGRFVTNGDMRTFISDYAFGTNTTFDLSLIVRASRWIYDGTAWGYPATPGLSADTHQALAPEEWVVAFGMVKALQFLTHMLTHSRSIDKDEKKELLGEIMERRQTWATAAAMIQLIEFPRPLHQGSQPMVYREPDSDWL